jgi:hypothetical protein
VAWAWLHIQRRVATVAPHDAATRWAKPAAAVQHWILPEFAMRLHIIQARLAH